MTVLVVKEKITFIISEHNEDMREYIIPVADIKDIVIRKSTTRGVE